MADGLIAATAAVHAKIIVTRNVNDFADTGLPVVNPWDQCMASSSITRKESNGSERTATTIA
jgi:hypothetical protein